MTLQHTQQKIEEAFEQKMGNGTLFTTKLDYNNMAVQHVKVVELKQFIQESISTALQDFIRETSVEEREITSSDKSNVAANESRGFNEAVRLIRQKQDSYLKYI